MNPRKELTAFKVKRPNFLDLLFEIRIIEFFYITN